MSHDPSRPPADGIWQRVAARVLPVTPAGRVLLLQARDPQRPDDPFWFTVGGALDPGESHVAGAIRELREETGMEVTPAALGAPFTQGLVRFVWDGHTIVQDQVCFALAVSGAPDGVSFAGHDQWERGTIVGHGWWTPDEVQRSGVATTPDLPGLMRQAIAHLARGGAAAAAPAPLSTAAALALGGSGWQAGRHPS